MPITRPCLDCGELTPRGNRCQSCASRRTDRALGYGPAHQAERLRLAATLPAPCGYCGAMPTSASDWVAAHFTDGDPRAGYLVACRRCNERVKARPSTSPGW